MSASSLRLGIKWGVDSAFSSPTDTVKIYNSKGGDKINYLNDAASFSMLYLTNAYLQEMLYLGFSQVVGAQRRLESLPHQAS